MNCRTDKATKLPAAFIFIVFCLLLHSEVQAQGAEIFQTTDWTEASSLAREQDKLIFVYAYKSKATCLSCTSMEKYVLAQESFTEFYDPRFVTVRLDLSRGDQYLFVYKYELSQYPSYLYLTWDGTLVRKQNGFRNIDLMVKDANEASRTQSVLEAMEAAFEKGERSEDFLFHYISKKDESDPKVLPLLELYLDTQDDWLDSRNIPLIFRYAGDIDSPLFRYVCQHKDRFGDVMGKEVVDAMIGQKTNLALNAGEISLQRRDSIYAIAYPERAEEMSLSYRMYYYSDRQLNGLYARAAIRYYDLYPPENPLRIYRDLDRLIDELYDETSLLKLLAWSQALAEEETNSTNLLRTAVVQKRLSRNDAAKETAKKALKYAKSEEEDKAEKVKVFLRTL